MVHEEVLRILKFSVLFITLLLFPQLSQAKKIHVIGPQSSEDVGQGYFSQLLQLALDKANPNQYQVTPLMLNSVTQGRSVQMLASKHVDVYWMGTSAAREEKFSAIKVPLMRGLLGYRIAIIHKDSVTGFQSLSPLGLKRKVACQGQHWPDTKVLQHNNFNVMPVAKYESMFSMVAKKRCDYFPRAIFEGYGELKIAQSHSPELVIFDDIILKYPFPMYFFVRKSSHQLAQDIKSGLEKMIDTGEFMDFMEQSPITKHLFPIEKWKNRTIIQLTNPTISDNLNLQNERYWFTFE
jgi:hypothetical protein